MKRGNRLQGKHTAQTTTTLTQNVKAQDQQQQLVFWILEKLQTSNSLFTKSRQDQFFPTFPENLDPCAFVMISFLQLH